MAAPEGTGSTRLVAESAVLRESSFRPVDSQLTDIGKIYTKIASFFLVVVGFVAPQVVSIYAHEVRSPL